MSIRNVVVFSMVLVLLAPVGAQAQATISLQRALRLAEERSRQIPAQDTAVAASRELAAAAGQRPDPVLKAGINNLPVNGPDQFSLTRDFMTMRSIGVMQEFTRDGKLKARTARFEREADAAEAARSVVRANLQRDTAIAWLDRHYQERLREVLVVQRDEARLQIEASDAAYRGGRGSQADLFAARAAVAQIEDRIAQAERQIASAKTRLARWIGEAGLESLGDPPATGTVSLRDAGLEDQLAHHPQIALLVRQEAVAEAEAQIARSERQADWNLELMYSQRGPAFSNMISFNVAIPLQWDLKNRQDRTLAAKLALVEKSRAEREEATRDHIAEARTMLQEWQSNRERLARYDTSLLPLAGERTRAALAAYRGSSTPLSSVLDARRNEIDVRMERIRLEMETARLWAQLTYLVPMEQTASAPARPFSAAEK